MSTAPLVLKFGGEALASPTRIAAAARRLAQLAQRGPLAVVASARRGVTDHLLSLSNQVSEALGGMGPTGHAERAIAAGEVVSASLLAHALEALGCPAATFDAREAGIRGRAHAGGARIARVEPRRIAAALGSGRVAVITGYQAWLGGRVTTLERGGSDLSAVALAIALQAERCVFAKDAHGLMTADPKLVPSARRIPHASLDFLAALASLGARVVQPAAATLARRYRLPIDLTSLDAAETLTQIRASAPVEPWAVTPRAEGEARVRVSLLTATPGRLAHTLDRIVASLAGAASLVEIIPAGVTTVVAAQHAVPVAAGIHAAALELDDECLRQAS